MREFSEEIVEPIANELLMADLAGLEASGPIARQGALDVYLATAKSIPNILLEIGRLREITFRSVGEGSGKGRDLDRYDEYYSHLFLWDREEGRIAGGYRLGRTDLIMGEFGFDGLYLSSLCECDESLLDYLNPALELGRSWVLPDYQRSLHALLGLWRGIGAFVARYPRYHKFGAVSVSDDYTAISQNLIVKYLRRTKSDPKWEGAMRPVRPFQKDMEGVCDTAASIEEVSAQVSTHEADGKGVPVLLRQYLKMNATLLDFGHDPAFQDCLDAMVLLDLKDAPEKLLRKYMGSEGYEQFLENVEKG